MTDPSHARVKAVFLAALDRPENERAAFLAEATDGDDVLREQVAALLGYHESAGDAELLAITPKPRFNPGDVFAGRYRMAVPLGAGGMGEVWRADDLILGEPVALKLLHTSDAGRRRALLNEVRLARHVTHPSVCRVFDIGEADGDVFLSMELVRGEDLSSLLRRVGRLSLSTVLDLGCQLCDGLSAAHARGVWHRDLKPGNILIDDEGNARLTDFGIAAAEGVASPSRAGTPGYMAPEQWSAASPVGPATDVWALGLVLLEMLTGVSPADTTPVATPDWRRLPPETPAPLRDVLERCLVSDPTKRLAEVDRVRTALDQARRVPLDSLADRSVLVLPFVNLSPDADNEYFSDGLTEDVIAELARVESLRVISRVTAMRFKDRRADVSATLRALNVRFVLDGSVRKSGDDVRVTVQLADSTEDRTLWSDRYTGTLDQVFQFQENTARAIAAALRVRVSADDERRLSQRRPVSALTYDLYLRTRRDILSFDPARISRAKDELERAHALDDRDVLICAGFGMACWQLVNSGVSSDPALMDRAEACAHRLLILDPSGPHGHDLLAHVAASRGQIREWVKHAQLALDASPRDPDALVWLAMAWTWAGHPEAARPIFARLETIEPLYDYLHFGLAFLAQTEGQFDAALDHIRRARALQPDMMAWPLTEIQLLLQVGRSAEARRLVDAVLPVRGEHPLPDMTRALVDAVDGEALAARDFLTSDLAAKLWPDLQYAYFVAQAYAALGERTEALRWLAQSTRRGFVHYPYLVDRDPLLAPLRDDPSFRVLMADVRAQWEALRPEGTPGVP